MCTREMTLGEEIINLTKRGIDVPTVERMYRKYIDLDEKGKSEGCYAVSYTHLDVYKRQGKGRSANGNNNTSRAIRKESLLDREAPLLRA